MTAPNILPDKLSDCIRMAAMDVVVLMKDPKVHLDFGTFCERRGNVCAMCLAGAALYRKSGPFIFSGLSGHDRDRACALDAVRMGSHASALGYIGKLDVGHVSDAAPSMNAAMMIDIPALVTYLMEVAQDYQEAGL